MNFWSECMPEMCSEDFESPSEYSYGDEVGNDMRMIFDGVLNHDATSVTHEGWNDYFPEEYEGITTCIDKALSSAPAEQSDGRTAQFNPSSPGDQLHMSNAFSVEPYLVHVQASTTTIHHVSVKEANNDLNTSIETDNLVNSSSMQICTDGNGDGMIGCNKLSPSNGCFHGNLLSHKFHRSFPGDVNFASMQKCTDRNGDTVTSCNNLTPTNGCIDGSLLSYKPDASPSSAELTVNTINACLPMLKQEPPNASQHSPTPPPIPRHFKAQEGVDQVLFFVHNTAPNLKDGYEWHKYGEKQIRDEMNPRSYFRCAVHGCPIRKWTQSYSEMPGSVHFYYIGRHNHPAPPFHESLPQELSV
ncbi:hypothetical protein KP509_28G018200 [Ceratopteris richardii]|uniref:WRKY domain-containing protein n=1 Tax=Ceratopteris richardii TaxID=49495 RepID=A0A8T2RBA9_CERRI|nr:hypothetical protein KP509_28G018200 [Ceratopteris richardii]